VGVPDRDHPVRTGRGWLGQGLGEFGAVSVVSGRIVGQTETMTLHVEERFQAFEVQDAYAASVVLALLAVCTLLAMTLLRRDDA
jgi:sulfate transport system permease protein